MNLYRKSLSIPKKSSQKTLGSQKGRATKKDNDYPQSLLITIKIYFGALHLGLMDY